MAETSGTAALAAQLGTAIVLIAMFVAWPWLQDRDDARLDHLREVTVQACETRTESVHALDDCVARTIRATGQKP